MYSMEDSLVTFIKMKDEKSVEFLRIHCPDNPHTQAKTESSLLNRTKCKNVRGKCNGKIAKLR